MNVRKFLKSRVIEGMLAGVMSFWLFAPFVPIDILFTVISGLLMALWIGITVTYSTGAWIAVRDITNPLAGRVTIAGVALIGWSITAIFIYAWVYQFLGQPESMRQNIYRAWMNWTFLIGTTMLLVVSTINGKKILPADSWQRVGLIVAMSIILTLAITYTIGGFEQ